MSADLFVESSFPTASRDHLEGGGIVQDRTIMKMHFAKTLLNLGLLDERDYQTYLSLFKHMSNFMCRPNIIIYSDINRRHLSKNSMRSRDVESELR